jgi:hypothetical protein
MVQGPCAHLGLHERLYKMHVAWRPYRYFECSSKEALFVFSVVAPWWPSQESDQTEIWSVRSANLGVDLHACMYKFSGQ